MDFKFKDRYDVEDLILIMQMLRGENGCPWDKEQDHHSIRQNLIEETYEAIEAIDNDDSELLREELGDVLLQVVFHSQIEQEQERFNFTDVANDISQKLIIRHPHIFGNVKADSAEEVLNNWADIKKAQKGQQTDTQTLNSVSKSLPALMRSEKILSRAKKAGFSFTDVNMMIDNLKSQIKELESSIECCSDNIEQNIGDIIFATVNLGNKFGVSSEKSLSKSCDKFIDRFEFVELYAKKQRKSIKDLTIGELLEYYSKAMKKM